MRIKIIILNKVRYWGKKYISLIKEIKDYNKI